VANLFSRRDDGADVSHPWPKIIAEGSYQGTEANTALLVGCFS
jgi:hypothetical protein